VCPNNYKEEEIRSLKLTITSKNKEMTSNKVVITEVHGCGREQKTTITAIIQ
jgi:hypothetical protein